MLMKSFRTFLTEDAEYDKKVRSVAAKAHQIISDWLKENRILLTDEDIMKDITLKIQGYDWKAKGLSTLLLKSEFNNLPKTLFPDFDSRETTNALTFILFGQRIPNGGSAAWSSYGVGNKTRSLIIFDLIPMLDVTDLDIKFKYSKNEFIHEYIHYLDALRQKGNTPKASIKMNTYFNSSREYNAYVQGGLNSLDEWLDTYVVQHTTFGLDAVKEELGKLMSKVLGNTPAEFVKKLLSNQLAYPANKTFFQPDFISKLRKGNVRRFSKRMYGYWMLNIKPVLDKLK